MQNICDINEQRGKEETKQVKYWGSSNKTFRNNRHQKINHQRHHPLSSYQGPKYEYDNHQPKSYVTQNNNDNYGYSRPTNFQNKINYNNQYEKSFKNPTNLFMNSNNPSFSRICPPHQTFKFIYI